MAREIPISDFVKTFCWRSVVAGSLPRCSRIQVRNGQARSWPGLEDEVERRLGSPAEAGEPCPGHDVGDRRLARLRTQREPAVLSERTGHAEEGGQRIVRTTDGVEVVRHGAACAWLHDHP